MVFSAAKIRKKSRSGVRREAEKPRSDPFLRTVGLYVGKYVYLCAHFKGEKESSAASFNNVQNNKNQTINL